MINRNERRHSSHTETWGHLALLGPVYMGGGGPQVGEVTCLGGLTSLSKQSLFFNWSRLQDRWGDLPHVTSPIWGVPPPYKRAPTVSLRKKTCLIVSDTFSAMLVVKSVNLNYDLEND